MTRTRRTVEISDALWDALELMSREMSVDRDGLINQALFTFARFNGYVTPGSVAPHAATRNAPNPQATAAPHVVQPLASPPGAVRRPNTSAPAVERTPAPEAPAAEASGPPRTATGSMLAVSVPAVSMSPVSQPPAVDREEDALAGPSPKIDPGQTAGGSEAAPTPPRAPPAAPAGHGAPTPFDLNDGLDQLVGDGVVEWNVPGGILADPAIVAVKGEVDGNDFFGPVQLLDASGTLLKTLQLGPRVSDHVIAQVLVDEAREPKAWKALHHQLARDGHIAEATLALARAVGAGDLLQTLTTWLGEHSLQRTDRAAQVRAEKAPFVLEQMTRLAAPHARKASYLMDELRQGAFAGAMFHQLALDQHQFASSIAAADLIRCALAINPRDQALYAHTHALIELNLGNLEAARGAVAELKARSTEQASRLTTTLSALFPKFDFWPAADAITTLELPVEPQPSRRTLADFRNAIQKAALRIRSVRERLTPGRDAAPWLPPTLDALLVRSKVTLEEHETIVLEAWQEDSLPQLLRTLRAEWSRLSWLCWLAGLDAIALPTATSKPRSPTVLGRALGLRARLLALRLEDAPLEGGFEPDELEDAQLIASIPWVDVPAGELDAGNAEVASVELEAVQVAVNWAHDADAPSPFFSAAAAAVDSSDEPDEEAEIADEAVPVDVDVEVDAAAELDEIMPTDAQDVVPPAIAPVVPPTPPAAPIAVPHGVARATEAPVIDEPAAPDRTAIVRPSGRKIWLEREGHDTLELEGMRFTVGREARCEIMIASPRVSREHASVLVDDEVVLVTDLNSSNGTFFNGERISRHEVQDGDVVQFGNELVRFRFSDPAAS